MTATVIEERVKERLGSCPVCKLDVLADAYAVCSRGEWYHVRCAIEQDEREAEASRRPAE
jgi:hypothetical protein